MQILVTVDTEADDQWKAGEASVCVDNVYALPRFQALCDRYEVKPTYLVTHEVAVDARASSLLKSWQDERRAEVGAHLHPWTTPPLERGEAHARAFPSELSDEVLRAKLDMLTRKIEEVLAQRPTSYRAGRWGFNMQQATILGELGYIVDTSITPGVSWKKTRGALDGVGGPDFTREAIAPHMLNDKVLEVPMTILRTGFLRRTRWLRIFRNTKKRDFENVFAAAQRMKLPAVVFMIHSSELAVGKSPYVKNEAELTHVYARLEDLFILCKKRGIVSATLSSFARDYHG